MHLVRWLRPALETAYAMEEPLGPRPATEEMLTILPPPGRAHRLDNLLDGAAWGRRRFDVDDLVPKFVGQAVDVGEVDGLVERAVVHEDVDAAELADRGGYGGPDLVEVGYVAGNGDGTNASGAASPRRLRRPCQGFLAYPMARLTPAVGQGDADPSSEYAAAAGYERGLLG